MNSYMKGFFFVCAAVILSVVGTNARTSIDKPACGGSGKTKTVSLVNPTSPPSQCRYQIKAYSKYVCQLRIDFIMQLAQPTLERVPGMDLSYAECTQDYFEVNGLRLCGVETWQHIYVPFNATAGVSTVDLLISLANRNDNAALPTPEWDMTVSQLECPAGAAVRQLNIDGDEEQVMQPQARSSINDGFFVAPPGCLQYFPQRSGAVKSFNYNNGAGIYPSKMNYAICFRRTAATTALNLRMYDFHLGSDRAASRLLTDNACYSSSGSQGLDNDYFMVPQATIVDTNLRATYFCGGISKDVVIRSDNPGPLMVLFNSGEVYRQWEDGFAFTYTVA